MNLDSEAAPRPRPHGNAFHAIEDRHPEALLLCVDTDRRKFRCDTRVFTVEGDIAFWEFIAWRQNRTYFGVANSCLEPN